MEANECLTCMEPMAVSVLFECGHRPICLKCFETYRSCYLKDGSLKCPFCQAEITHDPIVSGKQSLDCYPVEVLKQYQHSDAFHIFYDDPEIISTLQRYHEMVCPDCNARCGAFTDFSNHMKKHRKAPCEICNQSKRFLPSETPVFALKDLTKHMSAQHPKCSVCPYVAFDLHELSEHMRNNHFRCDICAEKGKILWFDSVEHIQEHFSQDHYPCRDPMCVAQGSIAFGTPMELQLHMINFHGADTTLDISLVGTGSKESSEESAGDLKRMSVERRAAARKKFWKEIRKELGEDQAAIGKLSRMFDLFNSGKMTPSQYVRNYKSILGDKANLYFNDMVAAINDLNIRAQTLKVFQGLKKAPPRSASHDGPIEEWPSLNETATPPPPPQESPGLSKSGHKKSKRVVLTSY